MRRRRTEEDENEDSDEVFEIFLLRCRILI